MVVKAKLIMIKVSNLINLNMFSKFSIICQYLFPICSFERNQVSPESAIIL